MENGRISKTLGLTPAHLPTLLLLIGYPVYWLELYAFRLPEGRTSWLATIAFLIVALWTVFQAREDLRRGLQNLRQQWQQLDRPSRLFFLFWVVIGLLILGIGLYASLLPPHLIQESDALNYHITLPRQHLITHSFSHIPWATADLYLLPVDFGLAPYWLATSLPNKFPQFVFFLGFIAMAGRLVGFFRSGNFAAPFMIVFALLASHNVGIQLGTAMLDVVLAYLLLAALDSFLRGNLILCALEAAFYFWAKSFLPIQSLLIVAALCFLLLIFKKLKWRISWIPGQSIAGKDWKRLLVIFTGASLLIGGPFVAKSLYYAGTPLFPFFPGIIKTRAEINSNDPHWQSIVEKAKEARATKDQYGSGRSPLEFARHLWLIAVPEKGVNNRYDYPVGLMYLLLIGPFLAGWIKSLRGREFSLLPFFVGVFWMSWWMGSHQTRFLFVPIAVLFIAAIVDMERYSTVLKGALTVALLLTCVSIMRAHKSDFGKSPYDVLRAKDKALLALRTDREAVELDFFDAAFAAVPVNVSGVDSVFVLEGYQK